MLFALLVTACAATPPTPAVSTPLPRIVLTIANHTPGVPSPAGSSTPRYGGGSYLLGQSAHAVARRIAKQYALKEVDSWPIEALAVHCVVYEVPAGQDVQDLLARLNRDARITLAQPLQEFHTLSDRSTVVPADRP
jgi:hypothetical protein